jgi:hypothetical protein
MDVLADADVDGSLSLIAEFDAGRFAVNSPLYDDGLISLICSVLVLAKKQPNLRKIASAKAESKISTLGLKKRASQGPHTRKSIFQGFSSSDSMKPEGAIGPKWAADARKRKEEISRSFKK